MNDQSINWTDKAYYIMIGNNDKWYYTSVQPETIGDAINRASSIKEFHYGEFTELSIYRLSDQTPFVLK